MVSARRAQGAANTPQEPQIEPRNALVHSLAGLDCCARVECERLFECSAVLCQEGEADVRFWGGVFGSVAIVALGCGVSGCHTSGETEGHSVDRPARAAADNGMAIPAKAECGEEPLDVNPSWGAPETFPHEYGVPAVEGLAPMFSVEEIGPPDEDANHLMLTTEQHFDARQVLDDYVCHNESQGRRVAARDQREDDGIYVAVWELANGDQFSVAVTATSPGSSGSVQLMWVPPLTGEQLEEMADLGRQVMQEGAEG